MGRPGCQRTGWRSRCLEVAMAAAALKPVVAAMWAVVQREVAEVVREVMEAAAASRGCAACGRGASVRVVNAHEVSACEAYGCGCP